MSLGVTFHKARPAVEFRQLVQERGGDMHALPADAFAPAGLSIRTVIVVIPC
ncbi:hypothetical protein [Microtetraspora fusca]|uniref:Uncharacterized protein n=1 Tax=Microtetraspora fusca TaxID=1997 RepID=A0ABW6VM78_MICFU|nr:hypothetical protein [Microtetraspora fusca]